jgi:hypothetical protein
MNFRTPIGYVIGVSETNATWNMDGSFWLVPSPLPGHAILETDNIDIIRANVGQMEPQTASLQKMITLITFLYPQARFHTLHEYVMNRVYQEPHPSRASFRRTSTGYLQCERRHAAIR